MAAATLVFGALHKVQGRGPCPQGVPSGETHGIDGRLRHHYHQRETFMSVMPTLLSHSTRLTETYSPVLSAGLGCLPRCVKFTLPSMAESSFGLKLPLDLVLAGPGMAASLNGCHLSIVSFVDLHVPFVSTSGESQGNHPQAYNLKCTFYDWDPFWKLPSAQSTMFRHCRRRPLKASVCFSALPLLFLEGFECWMFRSCQVGCPGSSTAICMSLSAFERVHWLSVLRMQVSKFPTSAWIGRCNVFAYLPP